eukprot:2316120-Amphidinium_carterae.1
MFGIAIVIISVATLFLINGCDQLGSYGTPASMVALSQEFGTQLLSFRSLEASVLAAYCMVIRLFNIIYLVDLGAFPLSSSRGQYDIDGG